MVRGESYRLVVSAKNGSAIAQVSDHQLIAVAQEADRGGCAGVCRFKAFKRAEITRRTRRGVLIVVAISSALFFDTLHQALNYLANYK